MYTVGKFDGMVLVIDMHGGKVRYGHIPQNHHPRSQRRYRAEVYEHSSMMEAQIIRTIITLTPWPLDIAITLIETSVDPLGFRSNRIQLDLKSTWMKRDAFGVIK